MKIIKRRSIEERLSIERRKMWLTLVGVAFVIVDESAVDKARASGSGVITGEIPVARMTHRL